MLDVSAYGTSHLAGPTLDLVKREISRVGAPAEDMKSARAFLASDKNYSARAYQALPPRVRRLVDLLTVADTDAIEMPKLSSAEEASPEVA